MTDPSPIDGSTVYNQIQKAVWNRPILEEVLRVQEYQSLLFDSGSLAPMLLSPPVRNAGTITPVTAPPNPCRKPLRPPARRRTTNGSFPDNAMRGTIESSTIARRARSFARNC